MARAFFGQALDPELCLQLKHELSMHTELVGSCHLWLGQTDRYGYGFKRLTLNGSRMQLKVHRLAYFLESAHILNPKMHVSHLCHNKTCVRLSHLSYEPQAVNNARKSCSLTKECSGHYGYEDCIIW